MPIASRHKSPSRRKSISPAAEGGPRPRGVLLAHARVRVRDLERGIEFYSHILGLHLSERVDDTFAFLSCDSAHHQIALQAVPKGSRRGGLGPGSVDHLAFEVRTERDLARIYRRLVTAKMSVQPVDNGISWALYFEDPDRTRLEVYVDRRRLPGGRKLWRGRVRPISTRTLSRLLRVSRKS
jgi:catechol-2,3-dioxygenase